MQKKVITGLMILLFSLVGVGMTQAQINILGGLSHERDARPDEIYEGEVIIRNTSQGIAEVKIYQTDYLFFCDGSNIYGEPGKIDRSNAKWITYYPKRLKIGPNQQEIMHYKVTVPNDEGLTGTYWSMLMVEPIPKESPESSQLKENEVTMQVLQIFRYGIQIATRIQDTGVGMLKFLDSKLLKEQENIILKVDVENIGEIFLRPSLSVELFDENGLQLDKSEGGRFRTFPGTSVRFKVDLGRVTEGTYKALVVADCGGNNIFGATYDLKIEK